VLALAVVERGRRHLWCTTRPRDGVLPLGRAAAAAHAGELATAELWDALTTFAEGGVALRGWAGVCWSGGRRAHSEQDVLARSLGGRVL
jgi:hypothetical protein